MHPEMLALCAPETTVALLVTLPELLFLPLKANLPKAAFLQSGMAVSGSTDRPASQCRKHGKG